jgi:hypothetical protein
MSIFSPSLLPLLGSTLIVYCGAASRSERRHAEQPEIARQA